MATTKKKRTLPRKLSSLIAVALEDLAAIERSKRYQVDMDWAYYDPENGDVRGASGKCLVCFAGSVMVRSLGTKSSREVAPSSFGDAMARKLYALDALRQGDVSRALSELAESDLDRVVGHPLDRDITPYARDPVAFRSDMQKLAEDLRKAKL